MVFSSLLLLGKNPHFVFSGFCLRTRNSELLAKNSPFHEHEEENIFPEQVDQDF